MKTDLLLKGKQRRKIWLMLLIIALLPPALLINLGANPLFSVNDEAIRILVAQEMYLSGDFITPTTFGDPYLNKPPLFNWLVILSSQALGGFNEFSLRIVSVLSLLFFGLFVYHYMARHFDRTRAFILSLTLVTSGRILFFDSFLGLIDIMHGMVIFWNFMLIYHSHTKRRYWTLFLGSYLLTTVAFFLKGMPAIVFQGITLITLFTYQHDLRRLFSLKHFVGVLGFLILTGTYYFLYSLNNELSPAELFSVLLDQSTQRTGISYGFSKTLGHIAAFPFELIYHFAPWTLLGLVMFRKGSLKETYRDPFLKYAGLIVLANLTVYWISPGSFARYLFMMVPLIYLVFSHLYFSESERAIRSWRVRLIDAIFLIFAAIPSLTLPWLPFTGLLSETPVSWMLLLVVWGVFLLIFVFMLRWPHQRFLLAIVSILCIRIVFNLVVLPQRAKADDRYLLGVRGVVEHTMGYPLFIYKNNYLLQEADAFYINQGRGDLLQRKFDGFTSQELLLVDDRQYNSELFEEVYKYACKWYDRPIRVCRMRNSPGDVVPQVTSSLPPQSSLD
ncbi:MAG: glycosyltransferase family 39 protein [Bacteroidales bacterium]|nr:glycosyltransferase family 39 protein [Bacteroidales bacterium]